MALDDGKGSGRVWKYRTEVAGGDQVWLEAFVTKIRTVARLEAAA